MLFRFSIIISLFVLFIVIFDTKILSKQEPQLIKNKITLTPNADIDKDALVFVCKSNDNDDHRQMFMFFSDKTYLRYNYQSSIVQNRIYWNEVIKHHGVFSIDRVNNLIFEFQQYNKESIGNNKNWKASSNTINSYNYSAGFNTDGSLFAFEYNINEKATLKCVPPYWKDQNELSAVLRTTLLDRKTAPKLNIEKDKK